MSRKLLVADDSLTIQKVIKLALSSENYDITAVSTGRDAIEAIQNICPQVVLIDVSLPDYDAYSVKRALNKFGSLHDIKFILMFSAFEKLDEKAIEEVVFHARLVKPFDPSNLRKVIANLVIADSAEASGMQQQQSTVETDVAPPPVIPAAPRGSARQQQVPPLQQPLQDLPRVTDEMPIVSEEQMHTSEKTESKTIDLQFAQNNVELTKFTEKHEPVRQEHQVKDMGLDNDIRNLTESTITMTGFDTMNWNMDDSRKKKSKPRLDDGGSTFLSDSGAGTQTSIKLTVPNPMTMPHAVSEQPHAAPPPQQKPSPQPSSQIAASAARATAAMKPPGLGTSVGSSASVSRSEIEALIRRDVEAALEKVIRESLPTLAASIIKKEIDRLLSEP